MQAAVGRRIRWEPIQVQAVELGLTDGTNKPPTVERVRQTWYFVRKEVVKQRALRVGGNRPSLTTRVKRAPATWLPPALAQPNAPPPSGGVHQDGQSAALPPVLPRQPEPPALAAASQDSSRPAPGSIEAARQKANLRSGLKANGDPLYKR